MAILTSVTSSGEISSSTSIRGSSFISAGAFSVNQDSGTGAFRVQGNQAAGGTWEYLLVGNFPGAENKVSIGMDSPGDCSTKLQVQGDISGSEMLAETGLIGFIFLVLAFFYVCKEYFSHKFNSLFHKKKYWSDYKILLLSYFLFHCGQLCQVVIYSTTGYQ